MNQLNEPVIASAAKQSPLQRQPKILNRTSRGDCFAALVSLAVSLPVQKRVNKTSALTCKATLQARRYCVGEKSLCDELISVARFLPPSNIPVFAQIHQIGDITYTPKNTKYINGNTDERGQLKIKFRVNRGKSVYVYAQENFKYEGFEKN